MHRHNTDAPHPPGGAVRHEGCGTTKRTPGSIPLALKNWYASSCHSFSRRRCEGDASLCIRSHITLTPSLILAPCPAGPPSDRLLARALCNHVYAPERYVSIPTPPSTPPNRKTTQTTPRGGTHATGKNLATKADIFCYSLLLQ